MGEGGEGFAVVAGEVKTLGERAQRQITEIASIVDEVADATRAFANDVDDIASEFITAINQANDRDKLLGSNS